MVKKKSADPGAKSKESYIFQAVARDKAPPQYNIYALPESMGKVEPYQKEICPRVKLNQKKFDPENMFGIPKLVEVNPETLVQKVEEDTEIIEEAAERHQSEGGRAKVVGPLDHANEADALPLEQGQVPRRKWTCSSE